MDSSEPHYATSDEVEELRRPSIKSVTVPETVKRRVPSKHYVYKVVVQWTEGKRTTIYRKYSFFFDFVVKLNELVAQLSPAESKKSMLLPELPGRVLFGRSEVHQVAEKRRKKIEEFCQKLIELPSEISQSTLVLGFFNTWPDDTMLRRPSVANTHVITAPVMNAGPTPHVGRGFSKSPSPPAASGSFSSSTKSSCSSSSLSETKPISIASNPISPTSSSPPLLSPQLDTALEAIISHPDEMESLEQYRVLSNYERKDSHQVNLVVNQLVHVIEKHDTGWWMVMSDDEQGYAPASYLEPVEESGSDDVHPEDQTNQVYEAMESYFAENDDEITIKAGERVEVLSKSMDGWWRIKCNGRVGFSPAALIRRRMSIKPTDMEESEKSIYEGLNIHRPPPRRNTIDPNSLKKVQPYYSKPKNQPKNIYIDSVEGESDEDTPRSYQVPNNGGVAARPIAKPKNKDLKAPLPLKPSLSSSTDTIDDSEHIYEMEPTPIYESTPEDNIGDDGSIYENTDFPSQDSVKRKPTSPATRDGSTSKSPEGPRIMIKKGKRHTPDDYEDLDAVLQEVEDYVDMDMDQHNTYIDPEDLRRVDSTSSATPSSSSFIAGNKRSESASSVPGPSVNGLSNGVPEPVFDDDYITMDPLYVEPPLEDDLDDNSDTLKANKTPPKGSPIASRPLPPPPYAGRNSPAGDKKILARSKSLEDLIASFTSPDKKSPKPRSPETSRKPPLPAPRLTSPLGKHSTTSSATDKPAGGKPKPPSRPRPPQFTSPPKANPDRSISPPSILSNQRRHPLQHTVSTPEFEQLPKTYVAMCNYSSQTEECLSFAEGDKCVLIKQSKDGWWLVNIGGREGWTPGEYWEEDTKREVNLPKPPKFAPKKLQAIRKPRSHTVGVDSSSPLTTSLDLTERKAEEAPASLTQSVDMSAMSVPKDAKTGQGKAPTKNKSHSVPTFPPLPPQKVKPVKPAKPPKPIVPSKPKPDKFKHSGSVESPSSPPTSRKNAPNHSPSPPPPLPPANPTKKRTSSDRLSPESHASILESSTEVYTPLNEISTSTGVENSPWFAGKMERAQAEQFLMDHGRQREFLIRERTTKDGYYALSVRYHYSCKHFNIDPSADGQYVMGTLNFPTINHIIQHYQHNSLFIHDGQHVTLSQPAVKKRSRSTDIRHAPSNQS